MTRVVTLLNQKKGGVGKKSTAAVNLAAVRAEHLSQGGLPEDAESPVAAISIDPQGSATWWANQVDDLPFHLIQAHDDPLDWLAQLNNLPTIAEVYVDTAGWFDLDPDGSGGDGLGSGHSADALRTVLDVTDEVLVPILTEPLCFDPTARTIRKKILEPRQLLPGLHKQPRQPRRDLLAERDERFRPRPWVAPPGRDRCPSLQDPHQCVQ